MQIPTYIDNFGCNFRGSDRLPEVTDPRSRIADLVHPLHFADEDTEVGGDWRAADKGKKASLLNPPDLHYNRTRKED